MSGSPEGSSARWRATEGALAPGGRGCPFTGNSARARDPRDRAVGLPPLQAPGVRTFSSLGEGDDPGGSDEPPPVLSLVRVRSPETPGACSHRALLLLRGSQGGSTRDPETLSSHSQRRNCPPLISKTHAQRRCRLAETPPGRIPRPRPSAVRVISPAARS